MLVVNFFIFIMGAAIGSFLILLSDRLPQGKDVVFDRSHCDYCRKKLGFWDLIPVLSYLLLLGKCRYCRKRLSLKYPLMEIVSGLGFIYIFTNLKNFSLPSPLAVSLFFSLFVFCVLLVVFLSDLQFLIIPDLVIIPLIVVTFFYKLIYSPSDLGKNIVASLLGFLFLYFLYFITKGRGMGLGDVKFALFMGLFLGYPDFIIAFYLAFLTGAVVGVILLLRKKVRFGQHIAFGPFLVLATVITFLWRDQLLTIFLKIFF